MRAVAQFTITNLCDVVTSDTAPENPYVGQLWVNDGFQSQKMVFRCQNLQERAALFQHSMEFLGQCQREQTGEYAD